MDLIKFSMGLNINGFSETTLFSPELDELVRKYKGFFDVMELWLCGDFGAEECDDDNQSDFRTHIRWGSFSHCDV